MFPPAPPTRIHPDANARARQARNKRVAATNALLHELRQPLLQTTAATGTTATMLPRQPLWRCCICGTPSLQTKVARATWLLRLESSLRNVQHIRNQRVFTSSPIPPGQKWSKKSGAHGDGRTKQWPTSRGARADCSPTGVPRGTGSRRPGQKHAIAKGIPQHGLWLEAKARCDRCAP